MNAHMSSIMLIPSTCLLKSSLVILKLNLNLEPSLLNLYLHFSYSRLEESKLSNLDMANNSDTPISERSMQNIDFLTSKVKSAATKAAFVIENKETYAPQLVAGSAAAVGM